MIKDVHWVCLLSKSPDFLLILCLQLSVLFTVIHLLRNSSKDTLAYTFWWFFCYWLLIAKFCSTETFTLELPVMSLMKTFDLAMQRKPVWTHLKVERFSAESDINCSGWQVSTEKFSAISAESDINYSERNCQCWSCHLRQIQTQTFSLRVFATRFLKT